ncbi:DJ-1/PfpI family protein [Thermoactinospora rubra]|uniref:DJ-1/PfpI family protein n=1 Tax=Thermoactinospora rubra TaxID=1088767 RepID=UPI001301C2A9|nr:DJ-1/PfpI family protein [Thermoactinospora rubra]
MRYIPDPGPAGLPEVTMRATERRIPMEQPAAPQRAGSRRRWQRFARHYLEMVVAMLAGMVVLGGALRMVLGMAGVPYSMERYPALTILEMGLTMTVAMCAWMRVRRHGWAGTLEMGAVMLAPAIVLVPLVWLDVLGAGTAMTLEHVVMFPAMLAVMLRRRNEYMAHAAHGRSGRAMRTLGRGAAIAVAFLLLPGVAFATGSTSYEASRYARPEVAPGVAATPPAHDPAKPTAVVLVGNHGANVADTLAPYEVLATTGAFNVYTVAPERRPATLLGGLDLIPDLSFAELRQRLGGATPDVVIVPEMPADETGDAQVTSWLRETAPGDGLMVSVCTGARLLAKAGLLDGRDATSHWYRLSGLQQDYPRVNWRRGTRYLDGGDVITTGGLLSSIDGTLRVIERLVGRDAAAAAARAVGWRYYSPGTAAPLPLSRLTPADAVLHVLNIGFRADATTVGVVLTDGVGELELAAAFAPYGEVKSARTLAVTAGAGSIRSRHGLTFVPRADLNRDAAGQVDRLLVPGAVAAAAPDPGVAAAGRRAGVPVTYLHRQPGFAFDESLREMARTMDVPTARWTAKILEYSAAELELSGPRWPWTPTARPVLLGLAGVAGLGAALLLLRRARARRS